MKLSKLVLVAAIACGIHAGNVFADQANDIQLVSCAAAACDCGQPVCGCETAGDCGCNAGCDGACGSTCDGGCGASCDGGCDSGCGLGLGSLGDCMGDCCIDDPCSLFGEHCGWRAGGWMQLGYHTADNGLFNTYSDTLQLQQAWLYAEKAIDTSCGFDIGGRIDYLYGTDGPNTQAFGIENNHWDNQWDNGGQYGHALPQLYMEAGYGDLSVKAGHFYTIIGYEVVQATGNFFYSHSYTFQNSEPFTHTGVLGTYKVNDNVTTYGGYVMGWDSGFEDNGDTWLSGFSVGLTDDLNLTYASTIGTFDKDFAGAGLTTEEGYMHSIVANMNLGNGLNYVFQSDYLDTEASDGTQLRESFGINQYLIKSINDCTGIGARFEWWNTESALIAAGDHDVYALTLGINHKPHGNVIVRPEIRWDWDDDQVAGLEDNDNGQTTFGVDTIILF